MNFENNKKILQIKNKHCNIIGSLQIPDNISQFGKPGYYPECLLTDLFDSYCVYCGDLLCPCEQYLNIEAKRKNNDNNGEPCNKKFKL